MHEDKGNVHRGTMKKNLKERDHLEELGVDWRLRLEMYIEIIIIIIIIMEGMDWSNLDEYTLFGHF